MKTGQEPSLLPPQCPPVRRRAVTAGTGTGTGVTAAAGNACKDLTGLAQQMCYASIYKI